MKNIHVKNYKLIILGASTAQLPIICKALEMGCYVITIDNIPDNIGHQFSHQYVNCSTVDQQGVCKVAQMLKIDGIITFASDVATTTVAFVAAALQLPACQLGMAETLSNKANFRLFQQQHNLVHPDFFIAQNTAQLAEHIQQINLPLLFKPVDTSGSRGITKIDVLHRETMHKAFVYAQGFSRSGKVSVEEYIEGVDVSGDGFLVDGQLCAFVSKKYQQGFMPTGHRFPTDLSNADQTRIFSAVSSVCQVLGYRDGPIDFDVKISDQQVLVLEMSPRLGGNGIPELIEHSMGIDLICMTLRYALGETCILPESISTIKHCGSWVFGSEVAGCIEHLAPLKTIKNKVSELISCRFNYQIGDVVPTFEHSGNSLGYAIFACPENRDYHSIVTELHAAMQLRVQEKRRD